MEEETKNQVEETENVEQTTEEMDEGIELTDTSEEVEENEETIETEGKEEVKEDEPKKVYTEDEFNEKFDAKFKRREAKIRKEYEKKYSKLENILNAGLGTSSLEEATSRLNDYYKEQGVEIPETELKYSEEDTEKLAKIDADEIISLGYEEIVEEGERLAKLGKNMSQREQLVLKKLTEKSKEIEEMKELSAIGVSKEQVEDADFQDYVKKLNPNLSLKEKYEMYQSTKPKKEIKKMESMKSGASTTELKDYYTYDEASKFTDSDYKKHPELYEIIERSMLKWK